MAGLHVFSLFACIWTFDESLPNLSHLPKSSNPPTWQASMCLAYLLLFGNLTKSCQIRHRYECGKISSKLPYSPLPTFLDLSVFPNSECMCSLVSHTIKFPARVVRQGDLKVICRCNYKGSTFSSIILRP